MHLFRMNIISVFYVILTDKTSQSIAEMVTIHVDGMSLRLRRRGELLARNKRERLAQRSTQQNFDIKCTYTDLGKNFSVNFFIAMYTNTYIRRVLHD